MSFIGSLTRSLVNPMSLAQFAMGPAGWASLAMRTIGSQIAMNALQQVGQRLGLPQSVISLAQASVAQNAGLPGLGRLGIRQAISSFAQENRLNPFQQGQLARAVETDLSRLMDKITTDLAKSPEKKGTPGARSWLMILAENLGRTADRLANEMDQMSQTLGSGSNQSSDNLKFAAKSQEFSQFFSSANNVIKTLGEALNAGARKN